MQVGMAGLMRRLTGRMEAGLRPSHEHTHSGEKMMTDQIEQLVVWYVKQEWYCSRSLIGNPKRRVKQEEKRKPELDDPCQTSKTYCSLCENKYARSYENTETIPNIISLYQI
jgi:hypothetical protein